MKGRTLALSIILVVVLAGAALGAIAFLRDATDDAVEHVPAHAVFYANVFLDPSAEQKMVLQDLLSKFPDAGNFDEAGDQIAEWFDEAAGDSGLRWQRDIEPWLGKQIAFYAGDFMPETAEFAALIATEDEEATSDALARAAEAAAEEAAEENVTDGTYKGIEYKLRPPAEGSAEPPIAIGVANGFLVVGTESGFKAVVDAGEGESLAESEPYEQAVAKLTPDRLALFFYNLERLGEQLESTPGFEGSNQQTQDLLAFTEGQSAAGVVFANQDGVVLETSQSVSEAKGGFAALFNSFTDVKLIPQLSDEAWGAFAIGGLGDYVQFIIDTVAGAAPEGADPDVVSKQFKAATGLDLQEDVLSWIGDVALFVQGDDLATVGGGAIIESTNPERSRATLKTLSARLERMRLPVSPTADGFSVAIPQAEPIEVIAKGDRVLVAYGRAAAAGALASGNRLAEEAVFGSAGDNLGRDYAILFYADIGDAVSFFEKLAPELPTAYVEDVKPNLDPLSYLIVGQRKEGDRLLSRVVLGVE